MLSLNAGVTIYILLLLLYCTVVENSYCGLKLQLLAATKHEQLLMETARDVKLCLIGVRSFVYYDVFACTEQRCIVIELLCKFSGSS